MSTGTLSGNIRIIRETGVYGTEMREAIASGIEQSFGDVYSEIQRIDSDIRNRDLFMSTSEISGTVDDYMLTITNPT